MKKIFVLLIILIIGYAGIYVFSSRLEKKRLATESFADEDLYFSARQLNLLGSDFKGLLADWYWVRSLQYLGDKLVREQEATGKPTDINNLQPLNPRLVYPMLDTASTLDPQFMTVYSFGASVLPAIDNNQAIKLLEKGIAANPDEWRLYHNLGYIYWHLNNFPKAAELFSEGSTKPGAPVWMKQMSVNMQAQGGSRRFAREVYLQMFETAEDEQTKNFAELRFKRIQMLDELDAIQPVLQNFQTQNKRCINDWREIFPQLKSLKTSDKMPLNFNQNLSPIDPTGVPYAIDKTDDKCRASLDYRASKIPSQ